MELYLELSVAFSIRPQITILYELTQLWPMDSWSREILQDACIRLGVTWIDVPTTMGAPAMQFSSDNFRTMIEWLANFPLDT